MLLLGASTKPVGSEETIKICMELCDTTLQQVLERDRSNKRNGKKDLVLSMKKRLQYAKDVVSTILKLINYDFIILIIMFFLFKLVFFYYFFYYYYYYFF